MSLSQNEVQQLLTDMDGLFAELAAWQAGQYDPPSEGFYYAKSSRCSSGRKPDIESTGQALNMLERPGLLESMTEEELQFILQTTLHNMSRLLRSDGGFSRELAHSPSAPNVAQVKEGEHYQGMPRPVYLSEGKIEGDMNAATQALLIRSLCYELAGVEEPLLKQEP
ncbi:hypothetical protein [Paenibacillus sp. PL91]|uniref:hypothetical protein n=1 Tax=Paenibacillus sp. PL91 TaxID=2729538 RepID=UPI00165A0134|nr:hypothetical protein [Paenibacillus sp. PL91]MBC9201710.1 hypothetical protein [Paenibacillus sp. PL91]